ncbi:hypothetical protein GCM10010428_50960 [Actinosynnema pretiosum subsp. pretiosum]
MVVVPSNQTIPATAGASRASHLTANAPDAALKRRSGGQGAKGLRLFDWVVASLPVYDDTTPTWGRRWLLIRRPLRPTVVASTSRPTTCVAPQPEQSTRT